MAVLALLAPGASAATVVNGDFETGTLAGWQQYSSTGAGSWFAYARKAKKRVKGKALNPAAAGAVKVPLVPTKAGQKVLDAKGKLKVKVKVTFTPNGGAANIETFTVVLKKDLPKD